MCRLVDLQLRAKGRDLGLSSRRGEHRLKADRVPTTPDLMHTVPKEKPPREPRGDYDCHEELGVRMEVIYCQLLD